MGSWPPRGSFESLRGVVMWFSINLGQPTVFFHPFSAIFPSSLFSRVEGEPLLETVAFYGAEVSRERAGQLSPATDDGAHRVSFFFLFFLVPWSSRRIRFRVIITDNERETLPWTKKNQQIKDFNRTFFYRTRLFLVFNGFSCFFLVTTVFFLFSCFIECS